MKISELNELNEDELRQKLAGFKRELFDLRMERASGKLAKPHRMQLLRRDAARALTLLREKSKGRLPGELYRPPQPVSGTGNRIKK